MKEVTRAKLRGLVIAVISAILLIIFVLPLLMNVYRGLRPWPRRVEPTPVTQPGFEASF